VLRFATGEVLEGQLNGRELETTFSFGQELEEEAADESTTGGTATYDSYTTITDDSGVLTVDVPTAWAETNGSAWTDDDVEIGPAVSASPDLDGFFETWNTPGMFFGATEQLPDTVDSLLDQFTYNESCTYGGRFDYEDPLYTGKYDLWSECGGTETIYIVLAVQPEDASFLALVTVQVVTDADLDALDTIMNTFIVNE
jgi:serine protease Do